MTSGPAAVLFDFSGTLFDDTGVATADRLAARCAERGRDVTVEDAGRLCRAILGVVDSPAGLAARQGADCSPGRHRRIWTELAASTPGVDEVVAEAFYATVTDPTAWRPYPDVPGVLRTLAAAGIAVAVVSNAGWDLREAFAHAGIAPLVDRFVLSCELGVEKPDPRIFRTACEGLGVEPGRALMVGDDVVKDGAAVGIGMPVYLLPSERATGRPRGLAPVLALAGAVPSTATPS